MTRVLVVYRHPHGLPIRPAIEAHLRALESAAADGRRGEITYHNSYDGRPQPTLRALEFDAVVLHTTFLCMRWSDRFAEIAWNYSWLRDVGAVRIAIPQDEYDHPETLDEWLYDLDVTDVFTNFDAALRAQLYPILHDRVAFHECLTGYLDEAMVAYASTRALPAARRPVDVVYRAAHLPYWFGAHGQLKHRIGDAGRESAIRLGLTHDISTRYEDVIVGDAWSDFLLAGKAVLGAESGSSVIDRRGEIQSAIATMLRDPELRFEDVDRRLPPGWDGDELTAVSPRHFEAIATRTCQLLVEGRYSGVLEPERHYIPIAADLSNLDDVLETVNHPLTLDAVAERAYTDIVGSGRFTYRRFGERLLEVAARERSPRRLRRAVFPAASAADAVLLDAGRATARLAQSARSHPAALLALRPSVTLRLAGLATRAATRDRSMRRLLAGYARDARWHEVPPRRLVGDLVRHELLREVRRRELRGEAGTTTAIDPTERAVVRTLPGPASPREAAAPPELDALSWDYSRLGTSLPLAAGGQRLAVGEDGVYHFRALGALAALYPSVGRRALASALDDQ